MRNKLVLTTKLDQRLQMSPQLMQAITLLQHNTLELKQIVQIELEQNPLLELEESDDTESLDALQEESASYQFRLREQSVYWDDDNGLENLAAPTHLAAHLQQQILLARFNPREQLIAEAIIAGLDEAGRLTMSNRELQEALDVEVREEEIATVVKTMQTLDPPGVCARTLVECLLIQLKNQDIDPTMKALTERLISHCLLDATTNNLKKKLQALKITDVEYDAALAILRKLDPQPGLRFSQEEALHAEPELYAKKTRQGWRAYLADSILTRLKIDKQYQQLLKQQSQEASPNALQQKLQEAQWLLKGIKRRNETLLNVANEIIKVQSDFFEKGPAGLKPLNIAEIAYAADVHESTISRVTSGKYIVTPYGVLELKYFFSSHLQTTGGTQCSATAVKELIKNIIAEESLHQVNSDGEIADKLKQQGISVARRTVTKYREAMNILSSYERAGLNSVKTSSHSDDNKVTSLDAHNNLDDTIPPAKTA